jgi:hypothetical protein
LRLYETNQTRPSKNLRHTPQAHDNNGFSRAERFSCKCAEETIKLPHFLGVKRKQTTRRAVKVPDRKQTLEAPPPDKQE